MWLLGGADMPVSGSVMEVRDGKNKQTNREWKLSADEEHLSLRRKVKTNLAWLWEKDICWDKLVTHDSWSWRKFPKTLRVLWGEMRGLGTSSHRGLAVVIHRAGPAAAYQGWVDWRESTSGHKVLCHSWVESQVSSRMKRKKIRNCFISLLMLILSPIRLIDKLLWLPLWNLCPWPLGSFLPQADSLLVTEFPPSKLFHFRLIFLISPVPLNFRILSCTFLFH